MPQPLSRVRASARTNFLHVGDRPLPRHPELAVLLAGAIASWAKVEAYMLSLFVDLMGGHASRATTVFRAFDNRAAKTTAIIAVANSVLSEERKKVLQAILAIIKSRQKERDQIAHGIWSDSPDLEDVLLLISAKDLISSIFDQNRIFVYRQIDFTNIIDNNERLTGYCSAFGRVITDHPVHKGGKLFHRLCAMPEIADKLRHQERQAQTLPSEGALPPDAWHQNECDLDPPVPD
jgi:hypothetical protein